MLRVNLQLFGGRGGSSSGGGGGVTSSSTSRGGGGGAPATYTVDEVPARIQSFTTTGETTNGETYESRTYVTQNGESVKTVTKYSDGTRTTTTDMKNYGTEYDRTRTQYERTLAEMAKSNIRAGVRVVAVNGKRK